MRWSLRPWRDLRNDPELVFRTGNLVGAARLASHLLSDAEDEMTRRIAAALGAQADWFYEGAPRADGQPADWPSYAARADERPTQVLPPPKES